MDCQSSASPIPLTEQPHKYTVSMVHRRISDPSKESRSLIPRKSVFDPRLDLARRDKPRRE